mmetsp:Transcript_264/g.934  ORF Transcript_264/g.934 Transcript_264/m.934 type:complete len:281 (-) Transcript_264:333-1175(-)
MSWPWKARRPAPPRACTSRMLTLFQSSGRSRPSSSAKLSTNFLLFSCSCQWAAGTRSRQSPASSCRSGNVSCSSAMTLPYLASRPVPRSSSSSEYVSLRQSTAPSSPTRPCFSATSRRNALRRSALLQYSRVSFGRTSLSSHSRSGYTARRRSITELLKRRSSVAPPAATMSSLLTFFQSSGRATPCLAATLSMKARRSWASSQLPALRTGLHSSSTHSCSGYANRSRRRRELPCRASMLPCPRCVRSLLTTLRQSAGPSMPSSLRTSSSAALQFSRTPQ